ncbi:ArsR/SmtB family transcription factor [Streptacidiphilus rugosus]|uniref:ArsR/SmtB family transcription factor n=1 Tax=Streptacidiphilus rugosus TaxID=405783 RepID=UPI000566C83E|nr:metalloregulator ArsR/SmtB family transcription factor [Streptacidiphilus rugosus]
MSGRSGADSAPEEVLTAVADPLRRQILSALARESAMTPTSLAAAFPVTRQAVAKHLAVLERAGLVRSHRSGREVRYETDPEPLRRATLWLDALATQWERRLDAIKALAEGTDEA